MLERVPNGERDSDDISENVLVRLEKAEVVYIPVCVLVRFGGLVSDDDIDALFEDGGFLVKEDELEPVFSEVSVFIVVSVPELEDESECDVLPERVEDTLSNPDLELEEHDDTVRTAVIVIEFVFVTV